MLKEGIIINKYIQNFINKFGNFTSTKIYAYKQFLLETDYIIIKMYEAQIEGEDIAPIKEKYKEILMQREEARKKINELEEHLSSY